MWYGEYTHTLDEKDRFILPAKFRDKLKQQKNSLLFITRGLEGCLFIFTSEVWRAFEERLKTVSFTKQQSRFFNRLFFSGASEIKPDSQGRVLIPSYLKAYAEIKREIIIVGVMDRIEIWSRKNWDKFLREQRPQFENIAQDLID